MEEYSLLKRQSQLAMELIKEVVLLRDKVKDLEKEIQLLKNNRKSNTSSTPPSQDYGRSNEKSLRQKTGKKTGGQQGHEGKNLQMAELPDEIIEHKPHFCQGCGEELLLQDCSFETRKQKVGFLPISKGTIDNVLKECTEKAPYEEILKRVQQSFVVGGDATGIKNQWEERMVIYFSERKTHTSFCLNESWFSVNCQYG